MTLMPMSTIRLPLHSSRSMPCRFGTAEPPPTSSLDLQAVAADLLSIGSSQATGDTMAPTLDHLLRQARGLFEAEDRQDGDFFGRCLAQATGKGARFNPLQEKYQAFELLQQASEWYATDVPSQVQVAKLAMGFAHHYDSGRTYQHAETLEPMFLVAAQTAINRILVQEPTHADAPMWRLQTQLSLRTFPQWWASYGGVPEGQVASVLEASYAPIEAIPLESVKTYARFKNLLTVHERMGDVYLGLPHHRQQKKILHKGPLVPNTTDPVNWRKALTSYDKADTLLTPYLTDSLHGALEFYGHSDAMFRQFYNLLVRQNMPNSYFYTKYAQLCDKASRVFPGEAAQWQDKAKRAVIKGAIINGQWLSDEYLLGQLRTQFPPSGGDAALLNTAALQEYLPQVVALPDSPEMPATTHARRLTELMVDAAKRHT